MTGMNLRNRLEISRNLSIVAGIFCLTVALLLILNYLQVRRYDPLESKAMEVLVQRLSEEPDNDSLKNDIRQLDLLARKAYFNNRWQVKTGSYLLLAGAILFAVAIRYYFSLLSRIEPPDQKQESEQMARLLTRRGVAITGGVLLLLALLASYGSLDHLKQYGITQSGREPSSPKASEGIEIIEVGESPAVAGELAGAEPADITSTGETMEGESAAEGISDEASGVTSDVKEVVFPDAAAIRAQHPSFRGPFGNGVSGRTGIPVDFDGPSGKNILWKVAVPLHGNSSPVIWGDLLFLTGAGAAKREVYCYDRYGGKLLWKVDADKIEGSPATPPKTTDDTGLAAPSVATDGVHVYAIFGTGDILAADLSGKRVWARNLGLPDNHYGHSSSLITWKGKVFVQYDTNKSRKLIALDALTGKTVWETQRNVKISWASPIMANIGGGMQLILAADPLLAGYDAETGKELWHAAVLAGEVGPSPAFGEGLVFAVNEYARLAAVNPANGTLVWENDEYLPEVASPVVTNGLLFVATSYGVLACYEAATGEKMWEYDGDAGFYSSPVVADGKLFLFNTEGILRVYAIAREMKIEAESTLGAKVSTTPAFANNRMYVRAGTSLYCIGSR